MTSPHTTGDAPDADALCALDDVLLTDALARRPSRPPDHAAEAAALGALAHALATDPRGLLQRVAETAMALCRAESAGVSILDPGAGPDGEDAFRWHATAGAFAPHAGGAMPPLASPCGEVTARDAVLLFDRPGRHFRAFDGVDPPIREGLLAPWHVGGAPAGTLWVIHHAPDRRFDAEDARLVASVARFAAAAWQTVQALEAAEAGRTELERRVAARTHELAEANAGLRASEARAHTLMATLPGAAVFVVDHELRYRRADGEALRAAGFAPGTFVGRTVAEVLDPALVAEYAPRFRRALAGEPFEWEHAAHGHVYLSRGVPLRDAAGRTTAALAVSVDVTAQRAAEAALRAGEARQAYLLALSDALRPLADAAEIQETATRVLGERLGASRVAYVEIDGDEYVIARDYVNGIPSMAGRYPVAAFGPGKLAEYRRGETRVVDDTAADPHNAAPDTANLAAVRVRAGIGVPLVKHGEFVATLVVHMHAPRRWTPDEVALVEETAERTWAALLRARAEERLRASEAKYRALFETMGQGYCELELVRDADGRAVDQRYLALNPAFARHFGVSAADATGRTARELFPDVDPWWHAAFDRIARRGEPERLEHPAAALGRWFEVFAYPRGGDRLTVLYEDVTERRHADEALRASEARYRALVENVRDYAIFRLDADGVVTDWTPGAERVKGYTAAEVVGRHVSLFYPPGAVARDEPARELAEAAATGRAERVAWRVRKGGERFWMNEIATAIHDAEGRLVGFTKISRDLTERRLAEEAAEQAQRQAARDDLRRQLAAAEEAERRRLARELHDQLGQELTAFRLGLDDAARLAAAHEGARAAADAPLLRRLAQLQALAQRLTAGARYVALELRPPELDDLGLESALATFAAEWSARFGVTAEVAVTGGAGRAVPPEVSSALYRIAQEALTNVAKHAAAAGVSVIVEKPDGEVRLIVEDDGRGFDPEAAAARVRRERRLGLAGMRERAALVGGTVAVESSPGGGTTVYVRLPVDHPPDDGRAGTPPDAPPATAGDAGGAARPA